MYLVPSADGERLELSLHFRERSHGCEFAAGRCRVTEAQGPWKTDSREEEGKDLARERNVVRELPDFL